MEIDSYEESNHRDVYNFAKRWHILHLPCISVFLLFFLFVFLKSSITHVFYSNAPCWLLGLIKVFKVWIEAIIVKKKKMKRNIRAGYPWLRNFHSSRRDIATNSSNRVPSLFSNEVTVLTCINHTKQHSTGWQDGFVSVFWMTVWVLLWKTRH